MQMTGVVEEGCTPFLGPPLIWPTGITARPSARPRKRPLAALGPSSLPACTGASFSGLRTGTRSCDPRLRIGPLPCTARCRAERDDSWREGVGYVPYREQTEWKLKKQDVDTMVVFFDPATHAAVSLLELGLCVHASQGGRAPRAIMLCPEGCWKRGNAQIACRRFGVETFDSVGELRDTITRRLPSGA